MDENIKIVFKRGEVYYADLNADDVINIGSEQSGIRPVLIIQNNTGNRFSPTVIVVPLTSSKNKNKLKTHIEVDGLSPDLNKKSIILCEQIKTIDKKRLMSKIGTLNKETIDRLNQALKTSLELK